MTAPVDVPVVVAANRPEAPGPKRTSLPSKLPPPAVSAATCWSAPRASSSGLPLVSNAWAMNAEANHSTNMAPNTAQPCLRSFAIFPNV